MPRKVSRKKHSPVKKAVKKAVRPAGQLVKPEAGPGRPSVSPAATTRKPEKPVEARARPAAAHPAVPVRTPAPPSRGLPNLRQPAPASPGKGPNDGPVQSAWPGQRARGVIDAVRWTGTKKPTLEGLQEMLRKEGLESELYSDPPRIKYGRHKHPFDDFVVIVSGRMMIATDTHEWVLKPGDRIDIPANTPHTAEMLGKEDVRWLSAAK